VISEASFVAFLLSTLQLLTMIHITPLIGLAFEFSDHASKVFWESTTK
jgi:hypothetical protein